MKGHGINLLTAGAIGALAAIMMLSYTPVIASDDPLTDLSSIKSNLEKRLEHDHIVPENPVTVQVTDGTITLTGTVESMRLKRKADQDARHVERDFVIVNQLTIKGSPMSDEQLQAEVMKSINASVFYGVFDWVTASVKNGVVTLEGVVDEPWHKGEIPRSVESVKGVSEIVNRIKVLPPSLSDEEMRHAAARAIYHELFDESYQDNPNPSIHIIVLDGDITLAGEVGSQIAKQEAENLVYYWTTAGRVTNNLEVK